MIMRLRSAIASTMAASLAFFVPGPAAAEVRAGSDLVGAALARFPEFAALPDSRVLPAPVMLQGTLSDLAGKPLSGAQVLVAAWPSNETVHALPPGGEFDVTPIARTVAGPDGSYALRSLLTPLLASLTGQDGLDIELDVFHDGRHHVYLSQVRMDGVTWVRDLVNGVDGQAAATEEGVRNLLDLALDSAQGEPLDASVPVAWPPPTAPGDTEPLTKDEKPFPGVTCKRYKVIGEPRKVMTTVATAVVRNGPTVQATYTGGAETISSTGVSFDNGATFSVNGARSRRAKFTPEFIDRTARPGKTVAREFRVQYLHNVLRRACLVNYDNHYKLQYMTSPDRTTKGGDDVASRYPNWSCRPDDDKSAPGHLKSVTTEDEEASTYEAAFGLAPFGGATLFGRALSGYSQAVTLKFVFRNPERGWWCGHTSDPGADGQRLQGYEA